MAIPAVCFLLLTVILAGSYGVSSTQKAESRSEIEATLETESVPDIANTPETEPEPILRDPSVTFTVLPQELVTKVGDTFSIQVNVANVSEMYSWQVCLLFDNRILECINVFLPHDYVFSYACTVSDALIDYNSTEFNKPLQQKVENNEGCVLIGDCLLGTSQPTFNGSGGLCQIEFRAISSGSSNLTLSIDPPRFVTFYVGPGTSYRAMAPNVSNGDVIVHSKD